MPRQLATYDWCDGQSCLILSIVTYLTVETGNWFKVLIGEQLCGMQLTVQVRDVFFLELSSVDCRLVEKIQLLFILVMALSGPPTSVLVIIIRLISCAPLEIIMFRLCPGSEIFLAPPLGVARNLYWRGTEAIAERGRPNPPRTDRSCS